MQLTIRESEFDLLIFERVGKAIGEAEAKLPPLSAGRGDGVDGVAIRDSIGTSFRKRRSRILLPPSREGGNKGRPDSGRPRWPPREKEETTPRVSHFVTPCTHPSQKGGKQV